jgi:pimeloyl-ACP methyl ester carboxylesterase
LDVFTPGLWTIPAVTPDLPRGDGHAVLFAPGLATGDYATLPARRFFADLGYRTHGWGAGINFGPTRTALTVLERRLLELNDRTGRRVSLVGRSLGGLMVRELAKAHPDRVRRLILICASVRHPIASHLAPLLQGLDRLYDQDYSRDP